MRSIPRYPQSVEIADSSAVSAWRNFYLEGLAPIIRESLRVTDKRPDNFLHVGLIKTLFPGAKIVHTRRNRLDNLLSLYFLHLGPDMPYALDLEDASHCYAQYERLVAHWKALYPDDIFDVDYDGLVQSPDPIMRSLLDFLELDWTPAVLDFHNSDRLVKTASVWQVRQPLHPRSSGRWRNYERWLSSVIG